MNKLFSWLFILLCLISCDNDLEINEEWKDITIAYTILNQQDSMHYAKVGKAFLGDADAIEMAKVFDTLYYGDEIMVSLEEYNSSGVIRTIPLITDTTIPKQGGLFSSPGQLLYGSTEMLNEDYNYRIVITNENTGKTVTGSTPLIRNFTIESPFAGPTKINFTNQNYPFRFKWNSAKNGRIYSPRIRFYYYEEDKITSVQILKHVDWTFGQVIAKNTNGGSLLEIAIDSEAFFLMVSGFIAQDDGVNRYASYLDFTVTAGSEELYTYMETTKPSTGILQEKPFYTNINDGVGLIAARFSTTIPLKFLTFTTIDSLACGQFTRHLNFADSQGVIGVCQ